MHGWQAVKTCISYGLTDLTRRDCIFVKDVIGPTHPDNAPVDGWGVSADRRLYTTQEYAGMHGWRMRDKVQVCRYAGDGRGVGGWSFLSSNHPLSAFISVLNQRFELLASQTIV
jgi:hypothetical protein